MPTLGAPLGGVQLEPLIVVLARAWPTVAEPALLTCRESGPLLSRVVTLYVQQFYSPLDWAAPLRPITYWYTRRDMSAMSDADAPGSLMPRVSTTST